MPATDLFDSFVNSITGPASGQFDVTPDDANDLAFVTRAIMVSTPGVINATWSDGTTSLSAPLIAGVQYSMRLTRILSTGTTATGIKGQY